MPAFRNIRRSRRISRQPPRDPHNDEYDLYDLTLVYPDASDHSSPHATTSDTPLYPADETGEPEVLLESPPLNPSRSAAVTGQRSSHSRKKKPGHIPRPPNAFMIFRSDLWNKEKIKSIVERDHRQISRIAGSLWNDLAEIERIPYRMRADEVKRIHEQRYPDYKYSPVSRRDKPTKRKAKPDRSEKVDRCRQVVRLHQRGPAGDESGRVLKKCDAPDEEGYSSDASEYVDGPQRKRIRKSPSKKCPTAPRRSCHLKLKVTYTSDEEEPEKPVVASLNDAPIPHAAIKGESSPPDDVPPAPAPEDDSEVKFIPTDAIPDISIGESVYDLGVEFINPFVAQPQSSSTPAFKSSFSAHDPLSPALGPYALSDDFLGSAGPERHADLSSPDDAFIGIFNMKPDPSLPPYDGLKPDYMAMLSPSHPYYAPEYTPGQIASEPDFSDWMHYD